VPFVSNFRLRRGSDIDCSPEAASHAADTYAALVINIKQSLEHAAWSTQEFIKQLTDLSESVYALSAAEGEWNVGRLLAHLADSGEWYRYILTGEMWTDIRPVTSHEAVTQLSRYLAELDSGLVAQADLEDELLSFQDESGPAQAARSMILAQAVMHSAEHKGQIAAIAKTSGFHLDLDRLDVWAFVRR
jgi:uncharacterized damage-inducible protein DinB